MNIDKRWFLLLAVVASAVAGTAILTNSRHRQRRLAHHLERRSELKAWENEGGNLAPAPAAAIPQ